MITKLGEVAGGVSGGKRGILGTKRFPSLPLRFTSPFNRQEIALTGFVKRSAKRVKAPYEVY